MLSGIQKSLKFEPESLLLFANMTVAPNDERRRVINRTIRSLKVAGIWPKLDCLYLFAAHASQAALINWKNPGTFNGTINGSPTFTADRGFTGTDASSTVYIDTGFNPSTAGGRYTQNSSHISMWSLTNAASTASGGAAMGLLVAGGAQSVILPKYSDNNAYYRVQDPNAGSSAGIANANSTGHYLANRSASGAQQGYRNAVDQGVVAVTSAALTNGNYFVLARNTVGTGANLGDAHQNAGISIGGSLSAAEVAAFYTAWLAYLQAVGAA